jgi:formate dehydrogenase iron-sulfur subunit
MYVLHHADKPEIYANLPKNPSISPLVDAWKGMSKIVGLGAIGFAAVAGVVHHLFAGANRVQPEDEEHAEELAGGDRT